MKPFYLGVLTLLGMMAFAALGVGIANTERAAASAQSGNPLLTLVRSESARAPIAGRVEERLQAGPYSYLDVRGPKQRVWVVTLGDGAPRGSDVRVRSFGRQQNFHSRRLQRTFPELASDSYPRSTHRDLPHP